MDVDDRLYARTQFSFQNSVLRSNDVRWITVDRMYQIRWSQLSGSTQRCRCGFDGRSLIENNYIKLRAVSLSKLSYLFVRPVADVPREYGYKLKYMHFLVSVILHLVLTAITPIAAVKIIG